MDQDGLVRSLKKAEDCLISQFRSITRVTFGKVKEDRIVEEMNHTYSSELVTVSHDTDSLR